ncbi:transposase [Hydrogenophaga sp.]|uniref:transposase n=1 Tax=Hydrogenophaga sp. TaxID=1904254 RepID=UPI003F6B0DA0
MEAAPPLPKKSETTPGAIGLVYFDESGFVQVHPNHSAWTPSGERHGIEVPRGQRLNVMAAIDPAGVQTAAKAGVTLKFLPPESPALNRIEVMWRLIKPRWLALRRRSKEELEQAVAPVFANFGRKFKMAF